MFTQYIYFIGIISIISLTIFSLGAYYSKTSRSFSKTPYLFPFGIFVWGDAVIFGLFWFLSSFVTFLLHDWILFLLIISTFWVVRSLGETIYWLLQQFSQINRNPPHKLLGYKIFKNDSIWFIYQIVWQSLTVFSTISTIYLAHRWLNTLK
jgi:ABC-type branched-subunit amino acid transport system permease subunit